jgi:hypothetical protein
MDRYSNGLPNDGKNYHLKSGETGADFFNVIKAEQHCPVVLFENIEVNCSRDIYENLTSVLTADTKLLCQKKFPNTCGRVHSINHFFVHFYD